MTAIELVQHLQAAGWQLQVHASKSQYPEPFCVGQDGPKIIWVRPDQKHMKVNYSRVLASLDVLRRLQVQRVEQFQKA